MTNHRARATVTRPLAGLLATLLTLLVTGPLLATPAQADDGARTGGDRVTVMTRNIYLGADINRPVRAAVAAQQAGKTPTEVAIALANATHVTRAVVDRTNFPVRAELLADEIVSTTPDLVGLQEVALWRSGPVQLDQVGTPNAETVDYDFLQILLDELAARGADYTAVEIGERADVEAPSFTGSPLDGSWAHQRDVRLTMHDVILMRADSGLEVTGEGDKIFEHNLAVPIGDVTMKFDRGFHWVDVTDGDTDFRFVNSHFEAFSSDLAYAQAAEVLQLGTATDRTTVFVCDCNSDPLNHSVKDVDTLPHSAPYDLITGPGGYTDQWLEKKKDWQGWTSGLSETVDDPTAAGFDHRIDMVFSRTATGEPLRVDRGQVTGDELGDRDPATGLWPSDHAGVVLRLRGL